MQRCLALKFIGLALAGVLFLTSTLQAEERALLNVSYDVTREFYQQYNAQFVKHWKEKTGETVRINQSHAGSSKQVRAVIDGLEADVVTMNQNPDIDALYNVAKLIPENWPERLPNQSVPFHSTMLFIVRKGNPKGIHDWDDLVKSGVKVIIPNPKTSGNGRYSYLGAWGYALKQPGGNEAAARAFVAKLFTNVPVLDTGGRGATTTFAQRGLGDVLLTFENEAELIVRESGPDKFDIITPSASILTDNPVVWIDSVVKKHGTEAVAKEYLTHLYSDEAQELAARHHFRPIDAGILARHKEEFASLKLFTVAELGGWRPLFQTHFADGGLFDQINEARK